MSSDSCCKYAAIDALAFCLNALANSCAGILTFEEDETLFDFLVGVEPPSVLFGLERTSSTMSSLSSLSSSTFVLDLGVLEGVLDLGDETLFAFVFGVELSFLLDDFLDSVCE